MEPEIPIDRFEIFANGLDHPECLSFDPEGFLWAGGEAGQVYRVSPEGAIETVAQLGGFSGGVAWSPDGDLWVCNPKHGVVRVKPWGACRTVSRSIRLAICSPLATRRTTSTASLLPDRRPSTRTTAGRSV